MPLDEFLLKQVVSLYKKKEYNYKIKKFLVSKNIEEEEIKQYMDQGREMAKSKQIKVFRLFWLLGAVGLQFLVVFSLHYF